MRHFSLKGFKFHSILRASLLSMHMGFGFSRSCCLCWDSDTSEHVWWGSDRPQVPIYASWSAWGCGVATGSRAFQDTQWETPGISRKQHGGSPAQDSWTHVWALSRERCYRPKWRKKKSFSPRNLGDTVQDPLCVPADKIFSAWSTVCFRAKVIDRRPCESTWFLKFAALGAPWA